MKKYLSTILLVLLLTLQNMVATSQDWKAVPGHIMTPWAVDVNPEKVWQEYPRPQMVRNEWINLNGLWDFAIVFGTNNNPAQRYNHKILVPFCVESALSGIKESVTGSQEMMYRRYINIPESWKGKRIILHFQAVDYYTKVWIDGKYIGDHKGGYDAFQFDITDALSAGDKHVVNLVVWDPSNTGNQPIGKQTLIGLSRGRYTPTSGIWQSVWMEPVPDVSINKLKIVTDIDTETLIVDATLKGWGYKHKVKVQVLDSGSEVATGESTAGKPVILKIKNAKL